MWQLGLSFLPPHGLCSSHFQEYEVGWTCFLKVYFPAKPELLLCLHYHRRARAVSVRNPRVAVWVWQKKGEFSSWQDLPRESLSLLHATPCRAFGCKKTSESVPWGVGEAERNKCLGLTNPGSGFQHSLQEEDSRSQDWEVGRGMMAETERISPGRELGVESRREKIVSPKFLVKCIMERL